MTSPRKEQLSDDVTLWLGDCRDVMASFPPCLRVDALIWDPPWGIGFTEYASHVDDAKAYPAWIGETLAKAEGFVTDGWCVVFQGSKRAWEWPSLVGREYRLMACAKNFTQILPGKGPLWSTDFALFWPVGTPRVTHGKGRDYHIAITSDMRGRPKGHPCPRPFDQMQYVVDCFSEDGMTVFDPTMGSGTTGAAAVSLGRKFLGIEIEPAYFDIACRRISEALRRPRLPFLEPVKVKQESLFGEAAE